MWVGGKLEEKDSVFCGRKIMMSGRGEDAPSTIVDATIVEKASNKQKHLALSTIDLGLHILNR